MMDTYGDGWNDAEWSWTDSSGMLIGKGTLIDGSSGTTDMCFESGCYVFEVSDGSYPDELSWKFTSPDGATTGSGVAGGPWNVCEGDAIDGSEGSDDSAGNT